MESTTRATNDISPISRLSPELLLGIFIYFRGSVQHGESWNKEFISYHDGSESYHIDQAISPTLFRVLLVCRYWREVALGCSTLWNHIPTIDPPLAFFDFILEYSRASSLSLGWIRIPSQEDEHRFAKLLTVLHRVDTLTLSVTNADLDLANIALDQIMVILSDSHIRYLSIRISSNNDLDKARLLSLPATLRSLSLKGVILLDSIRTPHSNLISLKITEMPPPWQCHLPGAFLDALAQLSNLESLTIDYVDCPIPRVRPTARSQPVHLPKLVVLEFCGTPAHFAYIHASLLPSSTTSYWVRFCDTADYDDYPVPPGWAAPLNQSAPLSTSLGTRSHELSLAFSELKRHLDRRLSDAIAQGWHEQFRLDCTLYRYHDHLHLILSPRADPAIYNLDADEDPGARVFTIIWEVDEDTVEDVDDYGPYSFIRDKIFPFLTKFYSSFPADIVAHLHLGMDASTLTLEGSPWRPSFLDWTALQSLHVEGAGVAAWLAPYLSDVTIPIDVTEAQRSETPSVAPTVFPNLKTLILDKINKSSFRYDHIWSGTVHSDDDIVKQWNRVLRARMASRMPLEKLGLIEGGGGRLWRRWLQKERDSVWLRGCDLRWRRDDSRGYETPEATSDLSEGEEDGWITRVDSDIGYRPWVESGWWI